MDDITKNYIDYGWAGNIRPEWIPMENTTTSYENMTTGYTEPKPMGAVTMRFSPDDLGRLLGLPPGIRFSKLRVEWVMVDDHLEALVVGEGLPVPQQGCIPEMVSLYTEMATDETGDLQPTINWQKTLGLTATEE